MSLKKRLLQNGLASIFQKGVRVLEQLLLVPFFISAWGAAYYGEWLTLTIIPSMLAFTNLGFGSAAANSFVLTYASGNKQDAADLNKTGMQIITLMVCIGLGISVVVLFLLDYFGVLSKSLINPQDAIWAVSILIFVRLLNFYDQLIEAYYRAAQRAALSINLISFRALFNMLAGVLVLVLGYGVVAFAISQLIVGVAFLIIYYLKGKQVIAFFSFFKGQRKKKWVKLVTSKGLSYLLIPLWQAGYFQGTTFVVRIVLGPEAVAIFNTVRTLSRSFNQIFYLAEPTIFPELQVAIGKDDWATARKIFRIALLAVTALSVVGVTALAVFGLWFYKLWTNNALDVPTLTWYVFISAMLFNAVWYTTEMLFRAVNKPKMLGIYGIIATVISVVATYTMAQYYQLNGAAIGAVLLDVILLILIVPNGLKLLDMSVLDVIKNGKTDFYHLKQLALRKLK